MRVDLHLRCRVIPGKREEFLAFVREARAYYESPGGIKVRVLENAADDHAFIELILYDDQATYERDQQRVEHDPVMRGYLERWRALLREPATVEVYRLVL